MYKPWSDVRRGDVVWVSHERKYRSILDMRVPFHEVKVTFTGGEEVFTFNDDSEVYVLSSGEESQINN